MKTLHGETRSYRSIYSVVNQVKSSGLVIYGAGFWGKISCQIFALFDVVPVCFCDDDPDKQGTCLTQGDVRIPVISLDEAAEKYPDAVYFSAASGGKEGTARRIMNSHLRERGLISEYSGFHPVRYLFLLEGGLEALEHPDKSVSASFQIESFKNMIISNHTGHSGSLYFNTLLDSHPNIVTLVSFPIFDLRKYYRKRLQYLEGKELVLEITSQLVPHFISQFPDKVYYPMIPRIAGTDSWYRNQDGQLEERIYIDPAKFITALSDLLSGRGKVSFAVLIKAIHAAYANTIGKAFDPEQTYWIYTDYHRPNYDICDPDELLSPNDFDRLEYWFLIREPIQQWFSVLNRNCVFDQDREQNEPIRRPDLGIFASKRYLEILSSDLGLMLEKTEAKKDKTVKVIRFEDAKRKNRATMRAVSKWMDIPFDESMLNTTVNGIPVYAPATSADSRKVISSTDTTAVDRRDFSRFMSSYDIFRLNLAFQNFKNAYGYDCDVPDYRDFSLEFLRELYKHPFRFETAMAEAAKEGLPSPEERPFCHEYITDLFMNYMREGTHELIPDVLCPEETEIEK